MTKNAASESNLGELHNKVAKVMTGALNQLDSQMQIYDELSKKALEEDCTDSMVEALKVKPEVNASLLSVMTKFLADNKISCAPEESKELSGLAQTLAHKKAQRKRIGNVVHLDETA